MTDMLEFPQAITDETGEYWNAVTRRDTAYDGRFVLGVKTTGIYCRPSCKSRMPLRRNVEFFAAPFEAEANGFRACKRCRPQEALYQPKRDLAQDVCAYIQANADQRLTLDDLAAHFHISPFHLQRTFRAAMGISPRQYAASLRVGALKTQLRSQRRVTDAIYAAGYNSSSRAYDEADTGIGMTLKAYQAGGQHETISWAAARCDLGIVLVAMTERGVCAVRMGDDEAALVDELHAEFPLATLNVNSGEANSALTAILAHLSGDLPALDLPLDVKATAFQWRVWQALRQIPYGETRTYGEIAEVINQPTAARAVGNACASNPVALIVPCHRVVKSGGDAGNYRWGVERKQRILADERRSAAHS